MARHYSVVFIYLIVLWIVVICSKPQQYTQIGNRPFRASPVPELQVCRQDAEYSLKRRVSRQIQTSGKPFQESSTSEMNPPRKDVDENPEGTTTESALFVVKQEVEEPLGNEQYQDMSYFAGEPLWALKQEDFSMENVVFIRNNESEEASADQQYRKMYLAGEIMRPLKIVVPTMESVVFIVKEKAAESRKISRETIESAGGNDKKWQD